MSNLLNAVNREMTSVVERVSRSLVEVHNGGGSFGAGVIAHADGLIVTNAHVVHNRQPKVRLHDGRVLAARVLAVDPERDLAALAVSASGLTPIELGDSSDAKAGQWVIALGHPWGVSGAVSAGAMIGKESDLWGRRGRDWLAAGLLLRPGNSGGPMVDAEGRLVGINTMINGPEIGLAVPVNAVKAFLREALGTPEAQVA